MSERALEDPTRLVEPTMSPDDAAAVVQQLLAEAGQEGLRIPTAVLEPLDDHPEHQAILVRVMRAWHADGGAGQPPPARVLALDVRGKYDRWRRAAMGQTPVAGIECQQRRCGGELYAATASWEPAFPQITNDGRIVCDSRCERCGASYTNVYGSPAEQVADRQAG